MRERPNFRIIESDYSSDYDGFKKDYMDLTIPKKKIIEKYQISQGQYYNMAKRVKSETGFSRKSGYNYHLNPTHNLHRNNSGSYTIAKQIKGVNRRSWGTYPSLGIAILVRDKLEENNYNEEVCEKLIREYGTNYNPSQNSKYSGNNNHTKTGLAIDDAYKKYDEFEELYFEGKLSKNGILDKLDFTHYQYDLCLAKIREKYGYTHKRIVRSSI